MVVLTMLTLFSPIMNPASTGFDNTLSVSITATAPSYVPNHTSIASDNTIWVVGNGLLKHIRNTDGTILASYPVSGTIYGMDIDANDDIWLTRGTSVIKVNHTNGNVLATYNIAGSYSISFDENDNFWLLSNNSILKQIDSSDGTVISTYTYGLYNSYSIDASQSDVVWMVHVDAVNYPTYNCVLKKIDASTGIILNSYPMDGGFIFQISIATDGYIWAVTQYNYLKKINPANGALLIDRYSENVNYNDIACSPDGTVWVINPDSLFFTNPETMLNSVNITTGALILKYYNMVFVPPSLVIYYTLNGADPDITSAVYTTPIILSATTTIKAKSFAGDYNPSNTTTETYTKNIPPSTAILCSNVLRTKLNQQFVALKDGDYIICQLLQPSVGWKTVGAINFEPAVVKDISLLNESFGSLLCMVQLSGGAVRRYRSKSQGAVWQDVTSEVT
jgi:hypothetical protein